MVGTEHYLTDWVHSRWWLKERLGNGVLVLPLVPVLLEGTSDKCTIRALVESLNWFSALSATEAVLMRDSIKMVLGTQLLCTGDKGWQADRQCFRLPAGLDTRATVATVSDGWGVPPVPEEAEKRLVNSLLAGLNEAFGLNLDTDPCMARKIGDINEQREADSSEQYTVILGSSHASRLCGAMTTIGMSGVTSITSSSWKLSKDTIEEVLVKLNKLEEAPDRIILQMLDNNIFFAVKEDGSMVLPAKHKDGKYHIVGELTVASKQQTEHLCKMVVPLLKWAPDVQKVLILPMPRYTSPDLVCCSKEGHITNRGSGLLQQTKSSLTAVKKTVRSMLFKEKVRNVRLVDPLQLLDFSDGSIFADPVHLTSAGYEVIAGAVKKLMAGNETDDSAADHTDVSADAKKIRNMSAGVGGDIGGGFVVGHGKWRPGRGRGGWRRPGGRGSGSGYGGRGSFSR
jgi:hypothetical protein